MSDSDKREAEVDRLRRTLDDWKEVLVLVKSVLDWDQPYFPGVIFGVITFKFLLLLWIDPTFIALVSMAFLNLALMDYVLPILAPKVFPLDAWGSTQEHEFNVICEAVVGVKYDLLAIVKASQDLKAQRPRVYMALSVIGLLFTAWIGSAMGDMLLFYFISLGASLYPGAKKHGIIQTYFADATGKVKELLFKQKST